MKNQELAQIIFSAARVSHNDGFEQQSWHLLFKWAALSWRSSTPRQVEQRKLASQLRQLTGCIGNLRILHSDQWSFYTNRALNDLHSAEFILRQQMATIKERIPA